MARLKIILVCFAFAFVFGLFSWQNTIRVSLNNYYNEKDPYTSLNVAKARLRIGHKLKLPEREINELRGVIRHIETNLIPSK
jgi:hypothetical protein